MKKNLLLFVILLLPLFSVSSESVATADKIDKHFFSSRGNRIPWKIPSDLIEPVLEESEEEEEEEEENLEENQQPLSCLLRGGLRISSDFCPSSPADSSLSSSLSLALPLLRAPPFYS